MLRIVRKTKTVNEEAPANSVGGGQLPGMGIAAQGKPSNFGDPSPQSKPQMMRRPPMQLEMGMFAGNPTIKVPSHVYNAAKLHKAKNAHWTKYLQETDYGIAIREFARKYPHKPIVLEDEKTGYMCFARYGKNKKKEGN
jgi:hypothetical protein